MDLAVVLMVLNEHDLSTLFASAPHGAMYAETILHPHETRLTPTQFAQRLAAPMWARLQQQREWPSHAS